MTDILTLAIALSVVLALRWGLSRLGETGAAMKACWDCGSLVTTQAPLPSILCSRCGGPIRQQSILEAHERLPEKAFRTMGSHRCKRKGRSALTPRPYQSQPLHGSRGE